MNNNIITIGTALKWRGIFDKEKVYYQDNMVLEAGCIFRCKVLQTVNQPPVKMIDGDGHFELINQDIWDVILDMSVYYNKIEEWENLKLKFCIRGYFKADGSGWSTDTTYGNTGYIPIDRRARIEMTGKGNSSIAALALFDVHFNLVSVKAFTSSTEREYIYIEPAEIPAGAVYFVASAALADNPQWQNGYGIRGQEYIQSGIVNAVSVLDKDYSQQLAAALQDAATALTLARSSATKADNARATAGLAANKCQLALDNYASVKDATDIVNCCLADMLDCGWFCPQSLDDLNAVYGTRVLNEGGTLKLDYPASAPEHVVWLDGPDEPLKSTDYSVEFEFQSSLALSDLSVMLFDNSMTYYKWDNNDPFIHSEVGAYSANEWHKVSIDMAKYIALTGWNQDKSGERLRINFNNIPASGEAVSISIKNIRVYHNQEVKAPEGTDLNTFAGKAKLTSMLIKAIDEAADADSISFMEKINEQMRTILNGETVKPAPVKAKGAASLKNTHTLYKGMISIFAEKGIVYRNIGYIKFPFYNAADVERTFSVADIAPALLTDTSFASVDYDAANQTITIHRETDNNGSFRAATIEVSKDWPYIMRGEDGIIRGYKEQGFAIADAPGLQPPSVAEIRKCLLDEIEYWNSGGKLGAKHSSSLEFERKKGKDPRRKIPSEDTVSGFTGSNQFDGSVSRKNKWRRISHLRGCGVYRVRRRSLSGRVSPWVVFTVAFAGEFFDLI